MPQVTDRQIDTTVRVLKGVLRDDIDQVTDVRIRKVLRDRYGGGAGSPENVERVRAKIRAL